MGSVVRTGAAVVWRPGPAPSARARAAAGSTTRTALRWQDRPGRCWRRYGGFAGRSKEACQSQSDGAGRSTRATLGFASRHPIVARQLGARPRWTDGRGLCARHDHVANEYTSNVASTIVDRPELFHRTWLLHLHLSTARGGQRHALDRRACGVGGEHDRPTLRWPAVQSGAASEHWPCGKHQTVPNMVAGQDLRC